MIRILAVSAYLLSLITGQLAIADLAEAQAPENGSVTPVLTVSVNGSRQITIFRGWPLLIEADLVHPRAKDAVGEVIPILLTSQKTSWATAVHLQVKNEAGKPQTWPFHLAPVPSGPIQLDSQTAGGLAWWVSPKETGVLSEGKYNLLGLLDTTKAPEGWRGTTNSVPVSIHIGIEPTLLSSEQEAKKFELLAIYHRLRGDATLALTQIDQLLVKQPNHIGGLTLKADLLAEAGQTREALRLYNRAVDAYYAKRPHHPEPPMPLLIPQRALQNELLR